MSVESLESAVMPPEIVNMSRPAYRLEHINQSLCYVNEEVSSECLSDANEPNVVFTKIRRLMSREPSPPAPPPPVARWPT